MLLGRHTARSRTPLALSRISRWTFLTQAIIDAVSFAGVCRHFLTLDKVLSAHEYYSQHTALSVFAEGRASISLFAPGFLYGVLFMSEMRLAMDIYQYQAPEDVVVPPPAPGPATPSPSAPASSAHTPINEDTEPLLAAEQGEARPIYPPAPAPAPTPATTTPITTEPPRPSFLNHIRSDPQARTCESNPSVDSIFVSLINHRHVHVPDDCLSRAAGNGTQTWFGSGWCRILQYMVVPYHSVCSSWASFGFEYRIYHRNHYLSTALRIMCVLLLTFKLKRPGFDEAQISWYARTTSWKSHLASGSGQSQHSCSSKWAC
jgi:hypothetical protein